MRWDDMRPNLDGLGHILIDSRRKGTLAKQMHGQTVQGVWRPTRTSSQQLHVPECIRRYIVGSVNHHVQRSMHLKYTIHHRDAVLDLRQGISRFT